MACTVLAVFYQVPTGIFAMFEAMLKHPVLLAFSLIFAGIFTGNAQAVSLQNYPAGVFVIDSFYMPQLERFRKIWVYLPPDYNETTKRYPVLYLQDGQNLFEDSTSFMGEWHVDETLDSLQKNQKDYGCIVIGIEHAGEKRSDEYMPHKHIKYGGGEGDLYVDFIINTLKPLVDDMFRTLPEAANTGIGGSSLGAVISFYAVLHHPEIFKNVLLFSPAFWIDDSLFYGLRQNNVQLNNANFYFLAGNLEGENEEVLSDVNNTAEKLPIYGVNKKNIRKVFREDGQHSEWFWSREFGPAYQWLFNDFVTR